MQLDILYKLHCTLTIFDDLFRAIIQTVDPKINVAFTSMAWISRLPSVEPRTSVHWIWLFRALLEKFKLVKLILLVIV